MRDPDRIDRFCDQLKVYWHKFPDWRFGQLISNVLSGCAFDPFYYEDTDMEKIFKGYFNDDTKKG